MTRQIYYYRPSLSRRLWEAARWFARGIAQRSRAHLAFGLYCLRTSDGVLTVGD